jgi:hypothetical protein
MCRHLAPAETQAVKWKLWSRSCGRSCALCSHVRGFVGAPSARSSFGCLGRLRLPTALAGAHAGARVWACVLCGGSPRVPDGVTWSLWSASRIRASAKR